MSAKLDGRSGRLLNGIGVLGYVLIVPFALLPLTWAILGSFKAQSEIYSFPPTLLPREFSLDAYALVLTSTRIPGYVWNSVIVASLTTVCVLILASVAAYGFSRWTFRFKEVVLVSLLVCQLIPTATTIIPYYLMMSGLGLLNSHAGLVIIFSATHAPFAIWILKSQFDSIPIALDEAAAIDGSSRLRTLFSIILPLSLPGLGAAGCLTFITVWAEFLIPLVIAGTQDTTLASVGLFGLFGQDTTTYFNRLFAATAVVVVPVVILYIFAQEQFIAGLSGGAEK
jgi:ABC-type glycerol-3-phosphate transport system permease component